MYIYVFIYIAYISDKSTSEVNRKTVYPSEIALIEEE